MRSAVLHLKHADPVLRAIVERVGPYRIRYAEPDFETVARSIVFQQLSGQSARAIFGRVKELVSGNGRMTPQGVLVRTDADLRGAGLSRRKAEYLRDLAEKTETGDIDFARLAALSDDDVIRQLSVVRGVGVWTAQMFLMFALRRPDVLPAGDLGIRSAIRRAYRLRTLPKPAKIERLAQKWHPYCSAASWYLWRSSDDVLLS